MPIVPDGPAPYPPVGKVLLVIERHRASGLPAPVTTDKIARLINSDALAPRVVKALELFDLIDEQGMPTAQFDALAKASAADFKERLAETIRAAYADVFQYIDPTTATAAEIEGQFRNYTPRGQLHRMVALFRSLCVYAEIIPSDQAQTLGAEPRPRRPQATTPRKPRNQGSRRDQAPPPKPGGEGDRPPQRYGTRARDAGDLHPFILTLLEQLPEVGAEWSAADRKAWTSFAESGFNLLYRLPSDDGGGGSD